jgi:hypothetical protein
MTYVATRKAIFLPELNTIDLNATIVVPNWALLVRPHISTGRHSTVVVSGHRLVPIRPELLRQAGLQPVDEVGEAATVPHSHHRPVLVELHRPHARSGLQDRTFSSPHQQSGNFV